MTTSTTQCVGSLRARSKNARSLARISFKVDSSLRSRKTVSTRRWHAATSRPSSTKQRNSREGSTLTNRRTASTTFNARAASSFTSEDAASSAKASPAVAHSSDPSHAASRGADQFSFTKAVPPTAAMASSIACSTAGKCGAAPSSSESLSSQSSSLLWVRAVARAPYFVRGRTQGPSLRSHSTNGAGSGTRTVLKVSDLCVSYQAAMLQASSLLPSAAATARGGVIGSTRRR